MISPRAADDFAIIRARLKELRRARARAAPGTEDGTEWGPETVSWCSKQRDGARGSSPSTLSSPKSLLIKPRAGKVSEAPSGLRV